MVFKAKRNALDGLYLRDGVVNGSPLQTVAEATARERLDESNKVITCCAASLASSPSMCSAMALP